jgi:hypothetical protein
MEGECQEESAVSYQPSAQDRVERTLLSAAFDFAVEFAFEFSIPAATQAECANLTLSQE